VWLKETWTKTCFTEVDPSGAYSTETGEFEVVYRADRNPMMVVVRWRPSVHMPRWASRSTLEIVSVSVEKATQDYSKEKIAEGQWMWVVDCRVVND
jgi:hypothetical protein